MAMHGTKINFQSSLSEPVSLRQIQSRKTSEVAEVRSEVLVYTTLVFQAFLHQKYILASIFSSVKGSFHVLAIYIYISIYLIHFCR